MTSKGSDQTAHMRRLICGFAGRIYHIVGNLMSKLLYSDIPRQNRICTVCSRTSAETEIHLLLECSSYSRERENFFMKLNQLSNEFNHKVLNVSHLHHIVKVRM